MLVESADFEETPDALKHLNGGVFRYCYFSYFPEDEPHVDADFIQCHFDGLDLYWVLFNGCTFASCTFQNCAFRGVSFASCRLVECTFKSCQFLEDNLGGFCLINDSRLFDCQEQNCQGWQEWLKSA